MIRLNTLCLTALLSIPTFSFASELPGKSDDAEINNTSKRPDLVDQDLEEDSESDDDYVLRVGDRIKIKLVQKEEDPLGSIKLPPMVWAISTYSLHEHKFSEDLVYRIKAIKYGIPNPKGRGIEINETNPPLIAKLEPLGLRPDRYRRVFWYLDIDKGVLAQHEDGSTIAEIESITIM